MRSVLVLLVLGAFLLARRRYREACREDLILAYAFQQKERQNAESN